MSDNKLRNNLYEFLSGYGLPDPMQDPSAAEFDNQIKNLSTHIADRLQAAPNGTIADVGSGRGVLLQRLASIDAFKNRPGWLYLAIDFRTNHDEVLTRAVELRIHRRVDVLDLTDFQAQSRPNLMEEYARPLFFVCRNVIHELDIPETAALIHNLSAYCLEGESVVLQDLQVFPAAERGNACWQPQPLRQVLEFSGFDTTHVEESTRRGNRWFTILGARSSRETPSLEAIKSTIIERRRQQYEFLSTAKEMLPGDMEARNRTIAAIDLDLQVAALQKQLAEARAHGVSSQAESQQGKVVEASLQSQLKRFDPATLASAFATIPRFDGFRDRAHSQDALQDFLLSNSQVAVIRGGPFMGKSVLAAEVLHRRAHHRHGIVIDVGATSTVWNLLERYIAAVGCKVSFGLVRSYREVKYSQIRGSVQAFVQNVAAVTVVVFDHFENLVDPGGSLPDEEIRFFLSDLAENTAAKVVLTTRRVAKLSFLPSTVIVDESQPVVGRFPRGEHIHNVLDDHINRALLGLTDYPDELIRAIDRLPYLAAIAGRLIQHEGPRSLQDESLLELMRRRLRTELLQRVATRSAEPALRAVSLLRGPVPRGMLVDIAGEEAVTEAENLGLVYSVWDYNRDDLVAGAAVLLSRREEEDLEDPDQLQQADNRSTREHADIADLYEHLYRNDMDPRWIRECYYHTLASGKVSHVSNFGAAYRGELFWAGDYWFRRRRDYRAALAAFRAAKRLGLNSYTSELRLAACLMRANETSEGEERYRDLLDHFPEQRGAKTSYVDSLLAINRHRDALEKLREFGFDTGTSDWIAHQFGRAYLGLHKYQAAVGAFEAELKLAARPRPITYLNLSTAYRRLGRGRDVARVLRKGLRRYPNSFGLRVRYAAHLIQAGEVHERIEAEGMLRDLLDSSPGSGRALQQLCKLLRIERRGADAREILEQQERDIYPEHYRKPINVEVLMAEERWEDALSELGHVSASDEHLTGLKKKIYLYWAHSEYVEDPEEIAQRGLQVPVDASLQSNVPLLVTHTRLAHIACADEELATSLKRLQEVNEEVARTLEDEFDSDDMLLWYFDDDAYSV